MNNDPSNKTRHTALIISGALDALLGSFFLLIGFHLLPIDITQYGFRDWHVLALGGIFFVMGIGIVAYNLSRLEE